MELKGNKTTACPFNIRSNNQSTHNEQYTIMYVLILLLLKLLLTWIHLFSESFHSYIETTGVQQTRWHDFSSGWLSVDLHCGDVVKSANVFISALTFSCNFNISVFTRWSELSDVSALFVTSGLKTKVSEIVIKEKWRQQTFILDELQMTYLHIYTLK